MMKHALSLATILLGALIIGLPSASACDMGLDDQCTYPSPEDGPIQPGGTVDCAAFTPGDPETGVVPMTAWYASSNAKAQCELAAAAQNGALRTAGNGGWMVGLLVVDGAGVLSNDPPVDEYMETSQNRAVFFVLSSPSTVGPVATATFNAASTALDTSCVYLTGVAPCV